MITQVFSGKALRQISCPVCGEVLREQDHLINVVSDESPEITAAYISQNAENADVAEQHWLDATKAFKSQHSEKCSINNDELFLISNVIDKETGSMKNAKLTNTWEKCKTFGGKVWRITKPILITAAAMGAAQEGISLIKVGYRKGGEYISNRNSAATNVQASGKTTKKGKP